MNKYIAEFIGTFFLVLTIGCTGIGAGSGVIAPLAIGAALMVMVFAGGDISGGAFNPAVAVGISLLGISSWNNIWIYLLADFAAAVVAAFVFNLINPPAQSTPIATDEPPYETPQ